jgi:hypothetical protein
MSDSRCKIRTDLDGRLFIKHGDQKAYPTSETPWNTFYRDSKIPTVFSDGSVVLKHHYPQTSRVRVRSEDATIQEVWFIE